MEGQLHLTVDGLARHLIQTPRPRMGGGKVNIPNLVLAMLGHEAVALGLTLPLDGPLPFKDADVGNAGTVRPPLTGGTLGSQMDQVVPIGNGHKGIEHPDSLGRSTPLDKLGRLLLALSGQIPELGRVERSRGGAPDGPAGFIGKWSEHQVHAARHARHGVTGIELGAEAAHVETLQYLVVALVGTGLGAILPTTDKVGGRQRHGSSQSVGDAHLLLSALGQQRLGRRLVQRPERNRRLARGGTPGIGTPGALARYGRQGPYQTRSVVLLLRLAIILVIVYIGQYHRRFEPLGRLSRHVRNGTERNVVGLDILKALADPQHALLQAEGHAVRDGGGLDRSIRGGVEVGYVG
mmetsp:Transcript_13913/g.39999  ORF Transcript_13913/g.39999 Transcript_13913/m.39999 type:complete len:351 (-) Transcript_13913:987-2039(-)